MTYLSEHVKGTVVMVIAVAAAMGWFLNIAKLIISAFGPGQIDAELVLRVLGVFIPPFGAIIGYM